MQYMFHISGNLSTVDHPPQRNAKAYTNPSLRKVAFFVFSGKETQK
jgi:hypothetical protein